MMLRFARAVCGSVLRQLLLPSEAFSACDHGGGEPQATGCLPSSSTLKQTGARNGSHAIRL